MPVSIGATAFCGNSKLRYMLSDDDIGTIISPLIMGSFIENGGVWTQGYRAIAYFQFILVAVLLFSIPLWKRDS